MVFGFGFVTKRFLFFYHFKISDLYLKQSYRNLSEIQQMPDMDFKVWISIQYMEATLKILSSNCKFVKFFIACPKWFKYYSDLSESGLMPDTYLRRMAIKCVEATLMIISNKCVQTRNLKGSSIIVILAKVTRCQTRIQCELLLNVWRPPEQSMGYHFKKISDPYQVSLIFCKSTKATKPSFAVLPLISE